MSEHLQEPEDDDIGDFPGKIPDEIEREFRSAMLSGSWPEERKFVLSELHRLDTSIVHLRKNAHLIRNELNGHNLKFIEKMQKLEIKLTRVTIWQTVILTAAAFIAKWLFKV